MECWEGRSKLPSHLPQAFQAQRAAAVETGGLHWGRKRKGSWCLPQVYEACGHSSLFLCPITSLRFMHCSGNQDWFEEKKSQRIIFIKKLKKMSGSYTVGKIIILRKVEWGMNRKIKFFVTLSLSLKLDQNTKFYKNWKESGRPGDV